MVGIFVFVEVMVGVVWGLVLLMGDVVGGGGHGSGDGGGGHGGGGGGGGCDWGSGGSGCSGGEADSGCGEVIVGVVLVKMMVVLVGW